MRSPKTSILWSAMRRQQAVIDGDQDPHGGAAVAVEQRDQLVGGEVVLLRADGQRGQHAALALGHGAAGGQFAQLVDGLAELIQQVDGEIDAAALDVFLDVAQDVGELEGDAGLFGEFFGARVGVAEDADADQADDRGDEVAVAVEIVEGCVGLDGFGPRSRGSRSMVVPATSSSSSVSGTLKRRWVSPSARKTGSSVAAGRNHCAAELREARHASSHEFISARRASIGFDSSSEMSSARRMKA